MRMEESRGTLGIAWQALRNAPVRVRLGVTILAMSGVLAILLQFGDDSGQGAPLEVAALLSVAFGTLGALLFGTAYMLHVVGQRQAVVCERRFDFDFATRRLDLFLVALPALSFAAGILLAAAAAMLLARAVLVDRLLLIPAAIYGALCFLAGRSVTRTTRFLYTHAREQAEAAARAEAEATEARLAALQAQMNPHFLFNALNTVAALVRRDARAAERTIENLASVLRRTLDRSGSVRSTVREEIEHLHAYLAVEQQRWRQRLHVDWAIDDDTLGLALPTMTLQPLVENALKYGVGARLEGGRVRIALARANGALLMEVSDDGPGFPTRWSEGTGLGNLRRRLSTLYGDDARIDVRSDTNGAVVAITLPATAQNGGTRA